MKLNSSGITFIEVILIIFIATIMLVLASAPSILLTDKMRFETYRGQLIEMLYTGQTLAKKKQECTVVSISGQSVIVKGYKTAQNCLEYSSGTLDSLTPISATLGQGPDFPSLGLFWIGTEKNYGTQTDSLIFNNKGFIDRGPAFITIGYKQYQSTLVLTPNSNLISEK